MKEFNRRLARIRLGSMLLLGVFLVIAAASSIADEGGHHASISSPSGLNFTDAGLSSDQAYHDVSGVTAESEGSNSNETLGKPASVPTVTRNLVASPGDARATLTWVARSGELTAMPFGPPSAPQTLQASPGDTYVNLTWQAPASDGTFPIINYQVWRGATSETLSLHANAGLDLWFNDTGLNNGQTYHYRVRAENLLGAGPDSSEVIATPSSTATSPAAPQDLAATAGNAQITLTWSAPANNGGSAITNYTVYRRMTSGAEAQLITIGNVLTHTDTGLANGQTYYYRISAVNYAGEGLRSNEASAVPATVPTAPRGLQAAAGDTAVDLNWTEPSYAGPGTLVYHLFRDGSQIWSGTGLAYTDSSVINGLTYRYQVAASNSIGYGENSTAVLAAPAPDGNVPTAPYGLTAIPSDSLIHLNWTAPSYSGPGTITYHLFRDDALIWSGSELEYHDASALSLVEYSYMVAAQNSVGWGPNSTEVHAALTTTVTPGVPLHLHVTAGDGYVNLSWAAPMNGGSMPILGYRIYRINDSVMTPLATVTSGTNYTDTAVSNGETYYYQICAFNSIGDGAATEILGATPQATRIDPFAFGPDAILYVGIGVIAVIALADVALIVRRKGK